MGNRKGGWRMGREGSGDEFMGTGKKGVGMGKVGWD